VWTKYLQVVVCVMDREEPLLARSLTTPSGQTSLHQVIQTSLHQVIQTSLRQVIQTRLRRVSQTSLRRVIETSLRQVIQTSLCQVILDVTTQTDIHKVRSKSGPENFPPHPSLAHSLSLPFLYIDPSTSLYRQFSPEDGDSIFLRNVGIYRRVYTAPKPRRTSSINRSIKYICRLVLITLLLHAV
jgi:hypothetical protein